MKLYSERRSTVEQAIKNHLIDAGCSEKSAEGVDRLYSAGRLGDALHQMKVIRCELIEELHQSQRKIDCLDYLIRQTEKEMIEENAGRADLC